MQPDVARLVVGVADAALVRVGAIANLAVTAAVTGGTAESATSRPRRPTRVPVLALAADADPTGAVLFAVEARDAVRNGITHTVIARIAAGGVATEARVGVLKQLTALAQSALIKFSRLHGTMNGTAVR